jgi:hypothetical protein
LQNNKIQEKLSILLAIGQKAVQAHLQRFKWAASQVICFFIIPSSVLIQLATDMQILCKIAPLPPRNVLSNLSKGRPT